MGFENLLNGSIVFLYFWATLSVLSSDSYLKKQKVAMVYVFTYGITFNPSVSVKRFMIYLVLSLFVYEEYMNSDEVKLRLIKSPLLKMVDFVFQYIFCYKILFVLTGLLCRTFLYRRLLEQYLESWLLSQFSDAFAVFVSGIFVILAIHLMLTDSKELNDFTGINAKFDQYPFYQLTLKNPKEREALYVRLQMICDLEDKTFFERKSYSFASCGFIHAYWKRRKKVISTGGLPSNPFSWVRMYKEWIRKNRREKVIALKKLPFVVIRSVGYHISKGFHVFKKIIKFLTRGHSTIEMQTMRILSYKRGLVFQTSEARFKRWKILKRKCYEVIYSKIFFSGLLSYLKENCVENLKYYRYYIVYIYLHTVQSSVFGKKYDPLDKAFVTKYSNDMPDIKDWPMEKLFIIGLGLTNGPITQERVLRYRDIIAKYQLDARLIEQMVEARTLG